MADNLQTPTTHAATNVPPADLSAWAAGYDDFALGCECADPALQIERWAQEAPRAGAEPH